MDPTSPASPVSAYPPIPSPEYRSRAPEFYGFVAWTSTSLLFILYVLWALLPDEYIIWLGVHWYPNREWAILIPAWATALAMFTYTTYSSMAIAATPSFSEMNSVTDNKGSFPSDSTSPYVLAAQPNAIPELYDIPIGLVNQVVHRSKKF
ncbi:PIG-P-domain-containing protein [Pluteus cervinus]|uniref:PIG-P-domain-containing protein n=1 Tax=Pluteus cervinus TaxID=181527 RepID=A0ACD3B314_9AGAR|nr:PIG-P-domain-containing protein [Pluteus cervinus]